VSASPDPKAQYKEVDRGDGYPFDRVPKELPYFVPEGMKPKFDLEDLIQYDHQEKFAPIIRQSE
jgi:hypothetical protein